MLNRLRVELGREVYDERQRRRWSLADLAQRAGVSKTNAQRIEAGHSVSLEAAVRVGVALNLDPRLSLRSAPRGALARDADLLHAAMGEVEVQQLAAPTRLVRLDEPYQHYQFAGRADVVVIDPAARALLHIENRTRFPDIQAFAGSWNAKRAYLAPALAQREGLRDWRSVDHVIVAIWSSEVLHTLRLRRHSFDALAPDQAHAWAAWWDGDRVAPGSRSALVLLDPIAGTRRSRRRWVGLDQVDTVDPRYRGYADAITALRSAGLA